MADHVHHSLQTVDVVGDYFVVNGKQQFEQKVGLHEIEDVAECVYFNVSLVFVDWIVDLHKA